MRSTCIVALLLAAASAQTFDLTLLITRDVRGAAYPVTSSTSQCDPAILQTDRNTGSCDCLGGAARRRAYLGTGTSTTAADVVSIDTGSYFSGSGTFYAAFNGTASATFFADAGYEAFGLTYRDFGAGGPEGLRDYLREVTALDSSMPKPVVTNYDGTGDTVLGDLIDEYSIISLGGGHNLAVLSLADPTHLEGTQPGYYAKLQTPFKQAISVTLGKLRRLATPPDVIAVIISDIPLTDAAIGARESAALTAATN